VLGSEYVTLRSMWTAADSSSTSPALVNVHGLVHSFATPTIEQHRRFSRDSSRSIAIGGRTAKTRFVGAQSTLLALYDELIQSVSGYQYDGELLADNVDRIRTHMDALHKVTAMAAVFAPVATEAVE
jgi:hypothetical protein